MTHENIPKNHGGLGRDPSQDVLNDAAIRNLKRWIRLAQDYPFDEFDLGYQAALGFVSKVLQHDPETLYMLYNKENDHDGS